MRLPAECIENTVKEPLKSPPRQIEGPESMINYRMSGVNRRIMKQLRQTGFACPSVGERRSHGTPRYQGRRDPSNKKKLIDTSRVISNLSCTVLRAYWTRRQIIFE